MDNLLQQIKFKNINNIKKICDTYIDITKINTTSYEEITMRKFLNFVVILLKYKATNIFENKLKYDMSEYTKIEGRYLTVYYTNNYIHNEDNFNIILFQNMHNDIDHRYDLYATEYRIHSNKNTYYCELFNNILKDNCSTKPGGSL